MANFENYDFDISSFRWTKLKDSSPDTNDETGPVIVRQGGNILVGAYYYDSGSPDMDEATGPCWIWAGFGQQREDVQAMPGDEWFFAAEHEVQS